MATGEIEEAPMLLDEHIEPQRPTLRNRSLSKSIPVHSMNEYVGGNDLVSHTGPLLRGQRGTHGPLYISRRSGEFDRPCSLAEGQTTTIVNVEESGWLDATDQKDWLLSNRNKNLWRSGKLGMCDDPYCTTCPTYYNHEQARSLSTSESEAHNMFSGGAKGWMRGSFSFPGICILGIVNPHAKVVRKWNKFSEISCLAAIFVDPLFFFLLSVEQVNCIVLDWSMAAGVAVVRSITDFIYLCHMLLQFRVAFVPPESTVVGGELVDQPKKIAFHYVFGKFLLDVFAILPFPQIMILFVSHSSHNSVKNILTGLVFLQYATRCYRCKPFFNGDKESEMPVKNASNNFCRNLLICILAGHVVGSSWYLFGLQRVNDCLWEACQASVLKNCQSFINCGRGGNIGKLDPSWSKWRNISAPCFGKSDFFSYGMFEHVVMLATERSIVRRSGYSFFWGLQQISNLGGNLNPSSYPLEILFGVSIVVFGLFVFALVVGDVLHVSQAIGWRRYEMQRRGTDVEQWMHDKRLPKKLRRKVRQSERFYWAATRGVNEEALLENLSEDLQREIYHHCFSFIKEVQIFAQMEGPILDAICGRLRQKLFIKGSKIIQVGGVVDKVFFIVRGRITSDGIDGSHISLSDGNLCGEEILSWCLGHSSLGKDGAKIRVVGQQLSNRTVTCLTNVNTYSLRASDLDKIAELFPIFWRRIQNTLRSESPYWREFAARSIQAAWRYRKRRLHRAEISTYESR